MPLRTAVTRQPKRVLVRVSTSTCVLDIPRQPSRPSGVTVTSTSREAVVGVSRGRSSPAMAAVTSAQAWCRLHWAQSLPAADVGGVWRIVSRNVGVSQGAARKVVA